MSDPKNKVSWCQDKLFQSLGHTQSIECWLHEICFCFENEDNFCFDILIGCGKDFTENPL